MYSQLRLHYSVEPTTKIALPPAIRLAIAACACATPIMVVTGGRFTKSGERVGGSVVVLILVLLNVLEECEKTGRVTEKLDENNDDEDRDDEVDETL